MTNSHALLLSLGLVALIHTPGVFAQHPPVQLFDRDYNTINPLADENANTPFSPEATCGTCHDYEEITSSYHFQMGWDKISDSFDAGNSKPWSLSDGLMGKWYPFAFRQLAKKKNSHADEIDLTVYDFVGFSRTSPEQPPCGACHPGGAGLQYDREGNRYDTHLADNPELRETLDGDYYQSQWDKSGVVEADCFVCHLERYDFNERIAQLERGNYQWAVVAATGLGQVEGSVKNGDTPNITYNKRHFNEDGTLRLPIGGPPPSTNCVYCHGTSDIKKRGFSWVDVHNPDVHHQQNVGCVGCHTADLDHQITKGDVRISTVADELDNTMQDCQTCHESGYMGATVPRHETVRPSHMKRISCESCHIPTLHRASALGFETTSGKLDFIINPREAKEFGEIAPWKPVYERREDGKIYPFNSVLAIWWGNLDSDGVLYPLFLREHEAGWKLFSDQVADDNDDGKPEVNRAEEMVAGLESFTNTLEGNRRFERVHPVLVKADQVFHLDETGSLATLDYDLQGMGEVKFSVTHIVAPASQALGAHGCADCHADGAQIFTGQRVVDLYDEGGQPVTRSNGLFFGCDPFAFFMNSLHQQVLSPVVSIAVVLVVFLIVMHYHSYGPKRIDFVPFSHEVERFSLVERGIHLFRMISFFMLTVTGLIMAFNLVAWQQLFFSSQQSVLNYHIGFGIVFIVTTVVGAAIWFKDALFAEHDKRWVQIIGGYLGYKGHVPAGRFNAGQKMFYWYTVIVGVIMSITGVMLIFKYSFSLVDVCLTSTVHNLAGFILIAGVLSHAYLGTIANPGTWRVLVDGYVTKEWAKHHHPYWYEEIKEKAESKEELADVVERNSSDEQTKQ